VSTRKRRPGAILWGTRHQARGWYIEHEIWESVNRAEPQAAGGANNLARHSVAPGASAADTFPDSVATVQDSPPGEREVAGGR